MNGCGHVIELRENGFTIEERFTNALCPACTTAARREIRELRAKVRLLEIELASRYSFERFDELYRRLSTESPDLGEDFAS